MPKAVPTDVSQCLLDTQVHCAHGRQEIRRKTTFGAHKSPKWRCALRRARRRPAPARPIHAPVPRTPIRTAHLHATHAKSAHEQCTAAHNRACAHTT
eukprot:1950722-Prymnesium_polylepis.1